MDEPDTLRRKRLAQHYLGDDSLSERLEELLRLAANSVVFPHAQVNVLDTETQYPVTQYPLGTRGTLPRSETICDVAVDSGDVLAVDDLRTHPHGRHLPGVIQGFAASYLGVALRGRESTPIGTLCFIDTEPRRITAEQIERTRQFGLVVEGQLDLVRRLREQDLADQVPTSELVDALARGQVVPWFQPVVDMTTGFVAGFEALARLQRPGVEPEQPAVFLPIAEDSDLVIDVDRAVARGALQHFAEWNRPGLHLNLNLSTRHLEIPDGMTVIHETVLAYGVDPADVDLELTETRRLSDGDSGPAAVARLRELGYTVLLDDFGNGWSSLDWLLRLPVQGIKIDRAVTAALGSPAGDAVSRAVATLTAELGLEVVVEGIDTAAHVAFARSLGYRYGQGFYWSPPVPPELVGLQL